MNNKEPQWRRRIAGQRGSERDRIEKSAPAPGGNGPDRDQADQPEPCGPVDSGKREIAGGTPPLPAVHRRTETAGAGKSDEATAAEASAASSRRRERPARRCSHITPNKSMIPTKNRSRTPYFERPVTRGR
jgi:hypothetical protein